MLQSQSHPSTPVDLYSAHTGASNVSEQEYGQILVHSHSPPKAFVYTYRYLAWAGVHRKTQGPTAALRDGGVDWTREPDDNGSSIGNDISNGSGKSDAADGESSGTRVGGEAIVLEVTTFALFHGSFRTCYARVGTFYARVVTFVAISVKRTPFAN